jgi:predicted solute-binding protein
MNGRPERINTNNKRSGYMQSEKSIHDATEQPSNVKAAEYVRMLTEHQQYSTDNQVDKIREYAAQRNIKIKFVRTYANEEKCDLNIGGRLALQLLIHDVESD